MPAWEVILRRARYLGRRSQFDQELEDEIRFHIEARAEELEADGMPAKRAREQARREFGSRALVAEDTRSAWQLQWLEDFWRDLCYAARMAAKSPAFTAVAVFSLALGVGANCAMFIVVDALLLRPLAVTRPEEVVSVRETAQESGTSPASYQDYLDLRDRSKSFDGLMAFTDVNIGFAGQSGTAPHTKDGYLVTANYFDVLGVTPALGRGFLPQENEAPGRDAVVVLSHALWKNQFNSDPGVLGKHIWLGGTAFTVVGVTPASFMAFDDSLTEDYPDYFVPLMMAPLIGSDPAILEERDARSLTMVGRLRSGVTVKQAQAEAATITASLEKQFPASNRGRGMAVQTVLKYRTSGFGGAAGAAVMLLAGAVLLVACANVAGLLTSRAASRRQEITVRLALGAGHARLIRQLLTESSLLAVAGGIAGIGLACIPLLLLAPIMNQLLTTGNASTLMPLRLDGRALLFTAAVALLSVILFGLMPAWQTTRVDLNGAMKGNGTGASQRRLFRKWPWGRYLLGAGQVAVSVLLLTASTVIYMWVSNARKAVDDAGFRTDGVLVIGFDPMVRHYKDARARQFYQQLLERARSAPGVASATLASAADTTAIRPEGYQFAGSSNGGSEAGSVFSLGVESGFFDALAIPVVRGRGFADTDSMGAPAVAVVSETLAKFYWPGQDAIGKRVQLNGKGRWIEVVGVSSIRNYDGVLVLPAPRMIFLPVAQSPVYPPMTLFARSMGDGAAAGLSLRAIVRSLDPNQAVPDIHHWGDMAAALSRGLRLAAVVIGAMGATGILLSLIGIFGLIAYNVGRRTREIGIRVALGASRGSLLRMAMWPGLVLAMCGIAAGLALNHGVFVLLMALLPANNATGNGVQVEFGDGAYFVLILAVLTLTTLAAYIPARRAVIVDASVALRQN